jgi:phosphoglycerol transferase MdoB-like AlkP superfamily enzyme
MGSLYLLGMIYLINVSSVSKTMIIEGEGYRSAIAQGFRKGTALALPLFMIFMVFLILVAVVGGFTKIVVDSIGTFSMFTLVLGFLLYQAFIFSRSLFRVMYLVSVQRAATEEDDR